MTDKRTTIRPYGKRGISSVIGSIFFLCIALLWVPLSELSGQVISNSGAAVTITNGIVVNTKDLEISAGSVGNNGILNLTGNYISAGTLGGNGLFNLSGHWTNLGTFNADNSTVSLIGTANQTITHGSTGERFYRLTINNPGNVITQVSTLGGVLTILNNLNLAAGTLYLGQTTANLNVGGKATIAGNLIYHNLTTQIATISDTLTGSGIINMSPGNLPHVLNLAGRSNSIGTFTTSPTGSSTVNYNGNDQTVFPALNYRNLIISNSGIKTLQGNSEVGLRLNISGGTFDLGTSVTSLNVLGSTTITGGLSFNGNSVKTVALNDTLSGSGSVDMSGGNLSHLLTLNGVPNSIGSYTSGTGSTVDYILNGPQSMFISNNYRNLRILGTGEKSISSDISASGVLTLSAGDINTNNNTLKITNGAVSAINRTAGKVIGKLQREVNATLNDYFYPIGSATMYNPMKIKFRNLTPGPLTAQFRPEDIGTIGLPLDDDGNEVWERDSTGYWTLTSFGSMASTNYALNLNTTGFTYVDPSSRVIKRTNGGSLELDGKHDSSSVFPEIKRDSLSKGISAVTTDFAIGRGRPRITSQPSNIDICEGFNAFFEVSARGRKPLTYQWQIMEGSFFVSLTDAGVYSGTNKPRLVITGAPYSMNQSRYRCIITDNSGNPNITNIVLLTVNKIPVAVASPSAQDECPSVPFVTINLTTSNSVTGTVFTWTRNNPAGISTLLPLNGTAIGDIISGSFSNTTDAPVTVTFMVTPMGPGTTYCYGNPIPVTVRVDPVPRVWPVAAPTIQCDSMTTSIRLQSPSIFSTGLPVSFKYTVSTNGAVSGYSTTEVNGLPNNHYITDKLANLTDTFRIVTYRVVPVSPVGCADGLPQNMAVTVNPTPRAFPANLKPDICFGGTTQVVLYSPTRMTSGGVIFDFTAGVTGAPGIVTGNISQELNRPRGYSINRIFKNYSDTIQSAYYYITPKVDNAICVPGRIFTNEVKVHAKPVQIIQIVKPLTCEGGSDATLRAIPSKGANPLKILWLEPYGRRDSIMTITNRIGGIYRLTITDNLGCSNSRDTSVTGAFLDSWLYAYPKASNPDGSQYEITCPANADGDIVFQLNSGGTPQYQYWLTRNSLDTTTAVKRGVFTNLMVPYPTAGLLAGQYTLIIKDAMGCYNRRSTGPGIFEYIQATINEPAPVTVTFGKKPYGLFNVSCKGYNNGKAWVKTISGGNGNYTYQWQNAAGTIIGTTDTINGLTAGKYYLITTDFKNCIKKDSLVITEPEGMVLSGIVLSKTVDNNFNISCNGGSDGRIQIGVSGGSSPYIYQWTGPSGIIPDNTNSITGLKAGRYSALVRDQNNCILTPRPDTVLTEPTAIGLISVPSPAPDGINNINCNGGTGSINLTVSGGSLGSYTFDWSTVNGSGIVAGQEDQLSLKAGTYSVLVKDAYGCMVPRDITLLQPQPLSIQLVPRHITCQSVLFNNGSVNLTVTGGATPYTYNWSNGSLSEDISGLTQGNYGVTVTDVNGCQATGSVTINLPPNLTYTSVLPTFNSYNISCFGSADGVVRITPLTGKAPFTYTWTTTGGSGLTPGAANQSGLTAGQYMVTIVDSNRCNATGNFNLSEPGKLSMSITKSHSANGNFNLNCVGDSTGTIDLSPVNNVGAVNYYWDDGTTDKQRSGLPAGSFSVVITDQNFCPADTTVEIVAPDTIRTSFVVKQALCPDSPDGQIDLTVRGGFIVTDYSYKWSDNSTTQDLTNILRGKYSVVVTDANQCTVENSVVMEPLNETCLVIPNAISPNADNINDVWNIGMKELYPQMEIKVFNRWGILLWKSEKGYPQPWDGRSNGSQLPIDSYHYTIDLHNGSKPIVGNITIVR